jgi:hypothetical protein
MAMPSGATDDIGALLAIGALVNRRRDGPHDD